MEEKQIILVSYKGSGVKTLNGISILFFALGYISVFIALIGLNMYAELFGTYYSSENNLGLALMCYFSAIGIILFAFGAILKGLSGIAKTALYKQTLLNQKYIFKEEPKSAF